MLKDKAPGALYLFLDDVSQSIVDDSSLELCNAYEQLLTLCVLSFWRRCGRSCGPLQPATQCGGLEDELPEAKRGAVS